jgi:hypothetical protein
MNSKIGSDLDIEAAEALKNDYVFSSQMTGYEVQIE